MISKSCHILGAGSIGQLWALSIRSRVPSYQVTLLLRGTNAAKEEVRSFLWKGSSHSKSFPKQVSVPVQFAKDEFSNDPIHTLLLSTKSYQAKDAVLSAQHRFVDNDARIILLCNGALSVRDELSSVLKDDVSLILATTTHGAYREPASTSTEADKEPISCLVHAGVGRTYIEEEATDLATVWNQAGLNCSTLSSSHMEEFLWKKLAANCVINPLTALFQCTNGELLMEPSFYELQEELLLEVAHVAQASTKDFISPDSLNEESLRQFVQQVIQETQQNKSSMLQDVLQQKQTEIHHLNNYIVRQGRALGLDCPANEDLVSRILQLPASTTQEFASTKERIRTETQY